MMKHKIKLLAAGALLWFNGLGQINPQINSGNPNFPFPQFMPYEYGANHSLGNLATKNAEGVVHAEMEQDIREAYILHTNEFAYTGEVYQGIKYIWTPYKSAYDCTEGDGYALLAAAYMADKPTFDGYWMCTHDKRRSKTKTYRKCEDNAMDYEYGPFAISDGMHKIKDPNGGPTDSIVVGGNTAADGDVDVALALYVAWKQWGDFMRNDAGAIVIDACGNQISYKQEMINVIRGLVAKSTRFNGGSDGKDNRYNSGMIGFDGYPKGGDTWCEQTNWASINQPGGLKPEFGGPTKQHIDYNAPAYYREFRELFVSLGGQDPWEMEQFRKGEASSDWLIGQLIGKNPKAIPTAGWVDFVNGVPEFSNFNMGEDYRCTWRTISNYMWHGNPGYSWDPINHAVVPGSNTHEYDAGVRLSAFLNDPSNWNPAKGSKCITYGDPKIPYGGPSTLNVHYDPMTGVTTADFFVMNWQNGTGTFGAVAAQDYELMGLLWRQCVIEWDTRGFLVEPAPDCNLNTRPNYMHGWARQLGMMVVSGNYHAPGQMNPSANMKLYRSIKDSVTFAYTGDKITYVFDYRNYGTISASGVKVVENVPVDFEFVSATNGGVYDAATHTVTWNIGTVPGFKTGGLAATKGQMSYTVRIGNKAAGRYCTTAEITCTNGKGWVTNEYPNHITPTMQRNCVDIIGRALQIEKTTDNNMVNDDNLVTFKVNFENSAKAGWLDGGRPRVNISFANTAKDDKSLMLKFRLFNDAIEPYINYGNYRISYYLFDAGLNCYQKTGVCPTGWQLRPDIYEPNGFGDKTVVSQENIVEGADANGKWNQRICVQFAPLLVTTTMHVSRYFGGANCRVHKGGASPFRGVWALVGGNYQDVDWKDDWSWGATYADADDGLYYPVTPSWQKLDANGKAIEVPINKWLTCGCSESPKTIPNILVEESDGYVWRRILGTGPMPGRDISNVVICDTLPKGLTFNAFVGAVPLADKGATLTTSKTADGRDIITWKISKLQVKQSGTITYTALAKFPSGKKCETADEIIENKAWIYGDKESQVGDTTTVTVTCAKLPKKIVPTTLKKTADKTSYVAGDNITYTLEYEQTHGSIVKNAAANPSDWTYNSEYSFSNGVLSTNGYATIIPEAVLDKAYGKNGYVDFVVTPGTYVRNRINFRIGSGKTITLMIRSMSVNTIAVTCYTNASVTKAEETLTFNGGWPYRLRIDLYDDLLRMWINKDTLTSPNYSVSGLPIGLGKFGFQNSDFDGKENGAHAYSNIYTHFDYAYDLSISDPVPSDITFVSATKSGAVSAGAVKWDLASGMANPVAPGTKYSLSWTGKVNSCNSFIENIAYANIMGHPIDSIAGQVVVNCGTTCTPPASVGLKWSSDLNLCAGESVTLTALQVGGGGTSYKYQLLESGTADGTSNATGVFTIKTAGKYSVSAIDNDDANCSKTSAVETVVMNPSPTYTVSGGGTVCKGVALPDIQLDFTGTGPWNISIDGAAPVSITANPYIISPTTVQTYTFNTFSDANCPELANVDQTADVIETPLPVASVTSTDHEYCGSVSDVTIKLSAPATADFAWSDGTATVNSNSSAFPNAPAGTYSVTVTDKLCKTVLTDITVSSVAQPTYTISGGGTVCKGQALPAVTIDFVGTGPWNFTLNNGSTTTALSTATSKYAVANVVAGTYTLDNVTDANCAGVAVATEKADVVVNPLPVISFVGLPAGICQNAAPLAISVSETSGTNTVSWTGGSGMSFDPTKQAPGNVTLKYIHTSAATNCTDSITKDIAIYAKPVASTAPQDTTICEGSNEPISGVATGGNGTYTKHQWIETTGSYLSSTSAQQVTFKGTAPIASYPLQYIVTDGNSCSDTAKVTITVTGKNNSLAFPALASVCEKSIPVILNTATPTGGIYSGTGVSGNLTDGYVFDPSNPAITGGKDYTLTYTYAPGSNCEVSVVSKITVKPGITLSFGSIKREYCSYDAVENLIGFTPATSVLSGTGITGTTFNPATAAIVKDKPFNIYLQNNDNGCTTRDSISLTVFAPPTVSFPAPAASFCSNDAAIDLGITPWDANASLVSVPSGLVSGKTFSPSLAATYGQNIDLNYTYTSATTSCTTSVSHSTIVYKTDKPVTKDEVCVVNTTVPNLTATGTDLKWYSDAALSNLVYSGASYNTGKTAQNVYTYYVTQTLNGCTSEAEQVKLTITDCMTPQVLVSDDNICAGQASKTLSVTTTSPLDADQSYRWYDETHTVVSTAATHTPTLVTGKSSYKFSVLIYDAGSACEGASSDVFFTVNALPTVSFNLPASVCQGAADIALVGSHVGGTFTGTGVTGNAVSGYSFSPSANGISGSIALTYKAMDQTTGCENSIVKNITVTEAPSQIVFAPTTNVCEGNTVTLAVAQTDADEIRWFDDYNLQVATGNSYSTNQLQADTHLYTAQAYKNSCKGISQPLSFEILKNPSAISLKHPLLVCNSQLDTAKIIAEIDGDSWTWTLVESGESIGTNETTLQYRDFITTPGNYTVVLDVSKTNSCTASYILPIDYSQLATPKISGPDRLCVGAENVTYQIDGLVQSDSYLWHLANDADYQNTSAGTSYSVNLNKVGAETVIVEQVSASNGCTAQGTLPIYIAAYPQAEFAYSKTHEEGVLSFTNRTSQQDMIVENMKKPIGFESWWDFGREGEAEVRRDGKEPFTEIFPYGIYTVNLRTVNDFGCEDSFVIDSISVTYPTGLFIPSALSPTSHGDQVSQFKPIGKGLKSYEIWIYDQWGNLVWYSNKLVNGVPAEGWDGTANGGYLPADVYTYRIEATFLNGEKWEGMPAKTMFGEKSKFGSIMLLR